MKFLFLNSRFGVLIFCKYFINSGFIVQVKMFGKYLGDQEYQRPLNLDEVNINLGRDAGKLADKAIEKLPFQLPSFLQNQDNGNLKRGISDLLETQFNKYYGGQKKVKTTSMQGIPSSIKSLDVLSQRMGFLPMGQIYSKPGFKYLGRKIIRNEDGQLFHQRFKNNDIGFIETPDLKKNVFFFANRSMQKWNQFVQSEANLQVYLNKIDSRKDQGEFIKQLAKSCSKGSSSYKILATLYHLELYEQQNLFNLPTQTRDELHEILSKPSAIVKTMTNINNFLSQKTQGNQRAKFISTFHDRKKNQFKASLQKSVFQSILQFLDQNKAYLSNQMINTPYRQIPAWVQSIGNTGSKAQFFTTQQWNPQNKTFKHYNYLQF